jgi:hypothetical protein
MRRIRHFVLFAALVLPAAVLLAQRADSLTVGATIRVTRNGPAWNALHGEFVSRDSAGAVLIRDGADGVLLSIARSEIRQLDFAGVRRSGGQAFGRGAAWGALTGLGIAAGVIAFAAIHEADHPCIDCWLGETAGAAIVSVPVVVLSPLIGGLVGLAFRERWTKVELRP